AGEERVLAHEWASLRSAGRDDLARKVRWVSEEDGDGAGYDIASFAPDGQARLIEVKTTNGWERTPFHITRNELAMADGRRRQPSAEWPHLLPTQPSRHPARARGYGRRAGRFGIVAVGKAKGIGSINFREFLGGALRILFGIAFPILERNSVNRVSHFASSKSTRPNARSLLDPSSSVLCRSFDPPIRRF